MTRESAAPTLPTYKDAKARVYQGGASELDKFVYVFTPKDREGEEEFRAALAVLLAAAEVRGAEREKGRCARLCVDEFARWKDAEPDSYGIAIGAIGAASNILCAIEGTPCVSDVPIHENESRDDELSPARAGKD